MLTIYTHTNNPLKKEFWKHIAKKALRKYSGPDAVLDSMKRGLTELHIPFEINPLLKPKNKNIHVLSGLEILKERISKKTKDQTLIVGPTIVVEPREENNILLNKEIDIILTPSDWVTDFYISISPELRDNIFSWPAGVKIPNEITSKQEVVIFKKDIDRSIFENIKKILDKKNIKYKIFEYGKFKKSEYIEKLKKTSYLVYLQKSESQGIALQEAWSYNVPTLVYKNTEFNYGTYSWSDAKIAAPYLTPESGLFFTLDSFDDIISKLDNLKFEPKKYCQENLSDKKSSQILLNIIQKHEKTH